ncbi:hypothetical protein LX36DRAFT_265516 [Colletotrichum falcatum]|nr:hypothetical protein LX36DRAFT_265516 [Colletotrichum falcatum]
MRTRTLPGISLFLKRSLALSRLASVNGNGNARSWRRPTSPGACRCRIHGRGTAVEAIAASVAAGAGAGASGRAQQQLRQLPPKPLNCSSNERPPPASDIIPTAGAKLGPPHKHDKTGDAEADKHPRRARPSHIPGTTPARRSQKAVFQTIGPVNVQPWRTIAYLARQSVIPNPITHAGESALSSLSPYACPFAIPCLFPRSRPVPGSLPRRLRWLILPPAAPHRRLVRLRGILPPVKPQFAL